MTERIYFKSTLINQCQAKIIDRRQTDSHYHLLLDRTLFHPQGGGQPTDRGMISGTLLFKLEKEGDQIWHVIEASQFDPERHAIGKTVTLELDSVLRAQHAALHTTGHLIDAIIQTLPIAAQLKNPNGNHFPDQAKVSYEFTAEGEFDKQVFQQMLEQSIQQAIKAELPIHINNTMPHRHIAIGDFISVGCGGTHLPNTRYIADFTIRNLQIKNEKRQGNTVRILTIGYRCVADPSLLALMKSEERHENTDHPALCASGSETKIR